jgi:hypothetical protein
MVDDRTTANLPPGKFFQTGDGRLIFIQNSSEGLHQYVQRGTESKSKKVDIQ